MTSSAARWRRWRAALCALTLGCSCASSGEESPAVAVHPQAIVYGSDDRADVFEHPDPDLRELARASVVALVPRSSVLRAAGVPTLAGEPLADVYGLCPDERFAVQPVAATCSGVLIDSDVVLTAAHCVGDGDGGGARAPCADLAFVFDDYYQAEGELAALSDASIYACAAVVLSERSAPGDRPRGDFAVVQLDRPATGGRVPVPIRASVLEPDQPLVAIGFPLGLPAKIDARARVVDARADRADVFSLRTDAFEGSSGGPVFDSERALVGILQSGGADFVQTDAGCAVAATVSEGEAALFSEQATYASRAIDALCEQGWPSARLCGVVPSESGCSVARVSHRSNGALWVALACALVACALAPRRRRISSRA